QRQAASQRPAPREPEVTVQVDYADRFMVGDLVDVRTVVEPGAQAGQGVLLVRDARIVALPQRPAKDAPAIAVLRGHTQAEADRLAPYANEPVSLHLRGPLGPDR